MAANSARSQLSEKSNTNNASQKRKRAPFSKSDALEILMAALNECIGAGFAVFVDHDKDGDALIQIKGTRIVPGEKGHQIVVKEPSDLPPAG